MSKAILAASVIFFAPSAPAVDLAKILRNASPLPLAAPPPPQVEAAEPKHGIPNVEGVDLPGTIPCHSMHRWKTGVKRTNQVCCTSGFGFGGGVEAVEGGSGSGTRVKVSVGGLEAVVGGSGVGE